MTSTQLRRLTTQKPDEMVRVVNTLVDMVLGNQTGRLRLIGDGGDAKALQGGAVLSSLNHSMQVQSAATGGQHAAFVLSATAADAAPTFVNSVVRILDDGLGIGAGKEGRFYHTDGSTYASAKGNAAGELLVSALNVSGAATLTTLTTTGNAVLGNAIGDTVTIAGPVTAGGTLGVTGITTLNNLLKIPGPAHYIEMGATPATTGVIRLTNNTGIYTKSVGGDDIPLVFMDNSDDILIGDGTNANNVTIECANEMSFDIGVSIQIHINSDGVGFNGENGVAPPNLSGSAAAAYDATTRQLINDIRDCLQGNGLAT